jgi:putrescine transport system ATP-binding protein
VDAGDQRPVSAVALDRVAKSFGGVVAVDHVSLAVGAGELFALLGPSGCGKTTLLRLIAGFETPDAGSVAIDGRDMTAVPAHRRPANMMFQSYALFPHMSVADNVAYGLRRAGKSEADTVRKVRDLLALVRLDGLEARKPHQLSGGQKSRVALARALAREPKVLLLDEPLSALDRKLREEMRGELVALQRRLGLAFIVVTHDQDEALAVADRIAVMRAGRIEQLGPPAELYDRPQTRFVAEFLGRANLFDGVIAGRSSAMAVVRCPAVGDMLVQGAGKFPDGAAVTVVVRPEKVAFGTTPGPANNVRGMVRERSYLGGTTLYRIELPGGASVLVSSPHRINIGVETDLSWSGTAGVLLAE